MQQLQDARDGGTERYCVLQNRSVAAAWIDLADAATWCVDDEVVSRSCRS